MKRVLFLAYLYPPIANSGTRRSLCFANRLPDFGWTPLVLTVSEPLNSKVCDPTLLGEIRPGTQVVRAPLASIALAKWVASKCKFSKFASRIEQGLAWRIAERATVPDEIVAWYPLAVAKGIAIHKEQGFDLIYASGWPWSSFLIARAVSKKTGCPYVLDYRDTWKPTGTHAWETQSRLQAWFGPWLERFAARRASAIVTVTPSLVDVIKSNTARANVQCITNGFEAEDFLGLTSGSVDSPQTSVQVSYTGVWRPGYGLEDLYRAVQKLKAENLSSIKRLCIIAAGFTPGPATAMGVDDVVTELGQIPHSQAVQTMVESQALFLPVPTGFYARASLPGKLFEYMGSGKPIIAVAPQDSEVTRVLVDVGGACVLSPGDIDGIAKLLAALCDGHPMASFAPRKPEQLEAYTRAATTRQLAGVFDEVFARKKRGAVA